MTPSQLGQEICAALVLCIMAFILGVILVDLGTNHEFVAAIVAYMRSE